MNKRVCTLILGMLIGSVDTDARMWRSASGSEIEADFVSLSNNVVQLKNADGKYIRIDIDKLNPADRAVARGLSVFNIEKQSTYKRKHIIVSRSNAVFSTDSHGWLFISKASKDPEYVMPIATVNAPQQFIDAMHDAIKWCDNAKDHGIEFAKEAYPGDRSISDWGSAQVIARSSKTARGVDVEVALKVYPKYSGPGESFAFDLAAAKMIATTLGEFSFQAIADARKAEEELLSK